MFSRTRSRFFRFAAPITLLYTPCNIYSKFTDETRADRPHPLLADELQTVFQTKYSLQIGSATPHRPMKPLDMIFEDEGGSCLGQIPNSILRRSTAYIATAYAPAMSPFSNAVVYGNGTFVSPHLVLTAMHIVSPYIYYDTRHVRNLPEAFPLLPLDEDKRVIGASKIRGLFAWDTFMADTPIFKVEPQHSNLVARNGLEIHGEYELVLADPASDLALIRVKEPSASWVEIVEKPQNPDVLYFIGFQAENAECLTTDGVALFGADLSAYFGSFFDFSDMFQGIRQIPAVSCDEKSHPDRYHNVRDSLFWDDRWILNEFKAGHLFVEVDDIVRADGSVAKGQVLHLLSCLSSHSGSGLSFDEQGKTVFAVLTSQQQHPRTDPRANQGTIVSQTEIFGQIQEEIARDILEYQQNMK